jgi:hypothetical protein
MKKSMLRGLLIAILCATTTFNALGMEITVTLAKNGFSALCSAFELFNSTNEIRNTYRYHIDILAENEKLYYSDAPEAIVSYIAELAKKRNLKEHVHVVVSTSDIYVDYCADGPKKTIYLPPHCAQELEELLLQKNILTDDEQKRLNRHTATIHHELTHLKYNDGTYTHIYENIIGTIGSFAIVYGFNRILMKQIPFLCTNYATKNIAKIARGVGTIICTRYIVASNLYSKYMEQRADDEIPNQKELLQAELEIYQSYHQKELEEIKLVKAIEWKEALAAFKNRSITLSNFLSISKIKIVPISWFNNPLMMDILIHMRAEHFSHLHRMERFRKRLAELEKQKAMA